MCCLGGKERISTAGRRWHSAWLLGFRVVSFFVFMALLALNVVVDGGGILYYYTQKDTYVVFLEPVDPDEVDYSCTPEEWSSTSNLVEQ